MTPKIITKTVKRMRLHAKWLRDRGLGEQFEHAADDVDAWADELDASDARETKPDPSKRAKKRKTAKK